MSTVHDPTGGFPQYQLNMCQTNPCHSNKNFRISSENLASVVQRSAKSQAAQLMQRCCNVYNSNCTWNIYYILIAYF